MVERAMQPSAIRIRVACRTRVYAAWAARFDISKRGLLNDLPPTQSNILLVSSLFSQDKAGQDKTRQVPILGPL